MKSFLIFINLLKFQLNYFLTILKFLTSIPLLFIFFIHSQVFSQIDDDLNLPSKSLLNLYSLRDRITEGDKNALREIGKTLSDRKIILEGLGYHILRAEKREIALRIIEENTLFLPEEIKLDSNLTAEKYLLFFKNNNDKIYFSKDYNAFLITPLEKRNLSYKIRELGESKKLTLENNKEKLLRVFETSNTSLDKLIKTKNPLSLKKIAEEYFKVRAKYDDYHFEEEKSYLALLQFLTKIEIGIHKNIDSVSYEVRFDPTDEAPRELLIYWTKHYKNYSYDENKGYFVNKDNPAANLTEVEQLFDLLKSKDDSTVFAAFIKLSNSDPKEVKKIIDVKDYGINNLDYNYALGSFPYRFLFVLSELTQYCRDNKIDYNGSSSLRENIELLKAEMDYSARLTLEDYMVDNLNFNELIAFEYWSAIYGQRTDLGESAGRILDKFYSRYWNEIINDDSLLYIFLKKASWFKAFGIIGISSHYHLKFENSSSETLEKIKKFNVDDDKLKRVVNDILRLNSDSTKNDLQKIKDNFVYEATRDEKSHELKDGVDLYIDNRGDIAISKKYDEDEQDFIVENAELQLTNILNSDLKQDKIESKFFQIVSKTTYEQIPFVISKIRDINFESVKNSNYKYQFLISNFGLPFETKELNDEQFVNSFIENHKKLSEHDLYEFYLDKKRTDYKNSDGTLNFDNIYRILKYDIVQPFAGGGGADRYTETYSIVKLLELHFNTRLGYTRKLCNCGRWSFRRPDNRAMTWMVFLKEKGLLSFTDDEPRSFYND